MLETNIENIINEYQFEFNEIDNFRTVTIGRYLGQSNSCAIILCRYASNKYR
jgi:hypothetical protein